MKIFNFLLVLKVVYMSDPFFINEVLVLENNYWGEDKTQIETKEGFLNKVIIKMNIEEEQLNYISIIPRYRYYDPDKRKYLFVFCYAQAEKVLSKMNCKHEVEPVILNFGYLYSDTLIDNDFSGVGCEGKLYYYENYKILNYETDDTIKFKDDGIKLYICQVKQRMKDLFYCKCIFLEDSDDDFLDQNLNVHLYYFSSQRLCYENYKKFIEFMNFLSLEKDDINPISQNFSIGCGNNILKMSLFDSYLENKFNLDYKNKKDVKIQKFYDMIQSLFEQCCDEIREKLMNHKKILPIKGTLTVEFYLNQFYELIKKAIESLLDKIDMNNCEELLVILCPYLRVFKRDIRKICNLIINNTWESLGIFDYFNELFGREILSEEDFTEVDKVLCDFYNVMRCVNEAKKGQNRTSVINLAHPMLKDQFECRIIKAFEIIIERPVEFGEIMAIDAEGKDILIEVTVDYFVRFFKDECMILIPFENIRSKNIQEIKIISDDGKYIKKIKVFKY